MCVFEVGWYVTSSSFTRLLFGTHTIPYIHILVYKDLVVDDEKDDAGNDDERCHNLCMSSIAFADDDAVEHSPNMD